MHSGLKQLRLIQFAMAASILLYLTIGEVVPQHVHNPDPTMFYALSFAAVTTVGMILVVRRTLVLPAEATLRDQPDNASILGRWRSGYIATYVLCELLAVFGFALRLMGFSLSQVAPLYLAGLILILFFFPRRLELRAT